VLQCDCQLSLESESCSEEERRFVGVVMWHSVLQFVAVCCRVLKCVAVGLSVESGERVSL